MLRHALRRQRALPAGPARLSVRYAGPADLPALERLAALDETPLPAGPMLVAEVGGEPWAAVALDSGAAIGDPFRPTGDLVLLLARRAAAIRRAHDAALRRPPWHRRALGRLGVS